MGRSPAYRRIDTLAPNNLSDNPNSLIQLKMLLASSSLSSASLTNGKMHLVSVRIQRRSRSQTKYISYPLNMYGCICYLLSYLCKPERNMSKLMKEALLNKEDTADILQTVKKTWSHNREMSYPEAVFHLNSLPLLWKSREIVYLATDYPENRIRSLKCNSEEEGDSIFNDGIIEYYENRPTDTHFVG